MRYPLMTRQEIAALPKEEQRDAFRSNPQASTSHLDCQCDVCRKRYSVNVHAMDRYRVQCPYCNKGYALRATTEAERRGHWATFRALGEGRCFSLVAKRHTVVGYHDNLMEIWEKA